jgi:hypothetical protein
MVMHTTDNLPISHGVKHYSNISYQIKPSNPSEMFQLLNTIHGWWVTKKAHGYQDEEHNRPDANQPEQQIRRHMFL